MNGQTAPGTSDDRLPPPRPFSQNLAVAPIVPIMTGDAAFHFRVKICGLTHSEQVRQVVRVGADAIGLNRVESSPRFVPDDQMAELAAATGKEAMTVAVVADPEPAQLERLADQRVVTAVQLHGHELPEQYSDFPLPYVRAIRLKSQPLDRALKKIDPWLGRTQPPLAILIDSWSPSILGGTGHTSDWDLAAELVERLRPMPVILAGGLTPENVTEAIRHVRPAGVDTASGVERSPGDKDIERVREFVRRAKAAWEQAV